MNAAFSIFLVGMMGAGKSTVGVRLARRLDRVFVDADRALEERLGVSVQTIFAVEGEEGFRRRESQFLEEMTAQPGLVLATGGGVVLSPANRELLKSRGVVVYLQASPGDLWQRLRRDRQRPLLRTANPRERIYKLCEERDCLYREVATHIVTTSRQPIEQIVDEVVRHLDGASVPAQARSRAPGRSTGIAAPPVCAMPQISAGGRPSGQDTARPSPAMPGVAATAEPLAAFHPPSPSSRD
ncbi:MAG: shikimate kinase [Lautropia sp.]|nr:shikimate kinase [Lautropia sp.]